MPTIDKTLYDLYYVQHNYDGVNNLYKKAKVINNKIKKSDVSVWLKKQATYQMTFKEVAKKKSYLPIYSEVPHSYQIDLTFLPQYKNQNNQNYVLFTAIGVNTRYAYVDFAKDKKMETIVDMMKKFDNEFEINHVTGDLGSEYTNKSFINFLNDNDIGFDFFKSDSHKLGIINRFHRTLKEKISKHMIATGKVKWIDVIEPIVDNYNHTTNSGIGAMPATIFNNEFLEDMIIDKKKETTKEMKGEAVVFKVGDKIRSMRIQKHQFENKMQAKYSEEVFTVIGVRANVISVLGMEGSKHIFKKDRVIKIDDVENYTPQSEAKEAVRENKIVRLNRKEDLIDAPMPTRTRGGGKEKK